MHWLVTGGCGFIGSNLVSRIRQEGEDVRVLDDLSVGQPTDCVAVCPSVIRDRPECVAPPEGLELVVGDIRDMPIVEAAMTGVDVVVHLAARTETIQSIEDPIGDHDVNVLGTLNCLEAARRKGVSRFVLASSGAPLGAREPPFHEEMAPRPASPYGASKLAGEAYCSAYHNAYGLGTVALRFSSVYGPLSGKKQNVVARLIRQALDQGQLVIYGDGTQTRDYLFVEDLVTCIVSAARFEVGGELFHVATGKETPLNHVVELLCEALAGKGVKRLRVEHEAPRVVEVLRSGADVSKVRRLLGWEAATSLEEGLGRTVAWFVEQFVHASGAQTREKELL